MPKYTMLFHPDSSSSSGFRFAVKIWVFCFDFIWNVIESIFDFQPIEQLFRSMSFFGCERLTSLSRQPFIQLDSLSSKSKKPGEIWSFRRHQLIQCQQANFRTFCMQKTQVLAWSQFHDELVLSAKDRHLLSKFCAIVLFHIKWLEFWTLVFYPILLGSHSNVPISKVRIFPINCLIIRKWYQCCDQIRNWECATKIPLNS